MGHWLIVGQTESGKTTFAKSVLAAYYRANKIPVVVCDPMGGKDWGASWSTSDPEAFLDFVMNPKKCLQCALFMDESGLVFAGRKMDPRFWWLTTTARHHGHVVHLISQKGTSIAPTMRENCANLCVFNLHYDYAKELARDFNCPEVETANQLAKGHYIVAKRFGAPYRGKVWWAKDLQPTKIVSDKDCHPDKIQAHPPAPPASPTPGVAP